MHHARPSGLGIGPKLALTIIFVSAAVGMGFGIQALDLTRASSHEWAVSNGMLLTDIVISVGRGYYADLWMTNRRIRDLELERARRFPGTPKADEIPAYNELQKSISDAKNSRQGLITTWQQYLPPTGPDNLVVTCAVSFKLSESFKGDVGDISRGDVEDFLPTGTIPPPDPDTTIEVGTRNGRDILVFSRRHTVRARDARPELAMGVDGVISDNEDPAILAQAQVHLSVARLEQTNQRLTSSLAVSLLLAMTIGVVLALLMASRITRPIRQLVDDIHEVATGDFEHRTRAKSHDEIGVMARAIDAMTQGLRAARDAEVEHRARERELSIARDVQANLLPRETVTLPGFDLADHYVASKEVGGDYYDYIPLGNGQVAIVVADVSGKGVPGALVMTMARAIFRVEAMRNDSPARILAEANRMIHADIKRGMFVTAMIGILDPEARTLRLASAGHNPLLLWRARERSVTFHNPKGIALGFDRGPIFNSTITEELIQLSPGDRVVMYTDGVIEAMSPSREEFGEKRFEQVVAAAGANDSNTLVAKLVEAVAEHQSDAPQHDDITIVTFKVSA